MSGASSTNNSWTILTPEEAAAETLKAAGTEHHDGTLTAAPGGKPPANGEESVEEPPVEGQPVPEEQTAELTGDASSEKHAQVPAAVTESPVPTSLEVSGSSVPDSETLTQPEDRPEGPAQTSSDPDSFSDSYTHITPSPEERPVYLLSTETLRGGESTREEEEERLAQEATVYPLNGEGLQLAGEESDSCSRTPDLGKQADSPVDSEAAEESTEKTGEEGEPEVRRRRSLLAAIERIGRKEEQEEGVEDFQLPPRDDDSGFSVNKCILGAVILLGLGTIFISDSEYATRELKDAELPVKQEWLNPEVPSSAVDADSTELLNKLAKENQQISELQAKLQAQTEELKVAKGAAVDGVKERLRWEEVEKENSRLKKEISSLPVLQKDNERMKRELESVGALHKELEMLRSTVTELKLSQGKGASLSPPSGQLDASTKETDGATESQHQKPLDDHKAKKKAMKPNENDETGREKSVLKEEARKEHKDGGDWKKGKHERAKLEKEKDRRKWHGDEAKQRKEKDKASRGDEGKSWKDGDGKKEWKDKNWRKESMKEQELKKSQYEKVNEGKQWRGKEKKDWKVGRDHGDKHKVKEEWKKGKDGFKQSGKDKWEKKDWKERELTKDGEWKGKKSKDSKEWKGKSEKKRWEESTNPGKERKGKDEGKQWKENAWKNKNGKDDKERERKDERKREHKEEKGKRERQEEHKDWKKDKSSSQKHKDELKFKNGHKEEHLWGNRKPPHSHRQTALEHPEYWVQQKDRLKHNAKPTQHCNSLESCAESEGLHPVPFPEFEAILQTYLTKAEEAGVDESKRTELKKLAAEFFKDGVFVHDQMSFEEFVEDVGDILEDMVEGDEEEGEEEDSDIEDEMEAFEEEVMKKFSVPGAGKIEELSTGGLGRESGKGRG